MLNGYQWCILFPESNSNGTAPVVHSEHTWALDHLTKNSALCKLPGETIRCDTVSLLGEREAVAVMVSQ